jgi:cob(I)alamin adenosyltransferase
MARCLLQIYTGNGKGKTTAATGLILRALGQDWRVLLVRFLKPVDPPSGELKMLRQLTGIDIIDAGLGGVYDASDPVAVAEDVGQTFARAKERLKQGYDLAVFDEFNGLFRRGYLALDEALELLDTRPSRTELVLTGRYAPAELIERADLVTSMDALRHPFEQGIGARQGIEY